MSKYYLMHKDVKCALLDIDDDLGYITEASILNQEHSPFNGNATEQLIKKWWEIRSVPASRSIMQEVIRKAGCLNSEIYLAKNLAISMTDAYWVKPVNAELSWANVNMWGLSAYNEGHIPYHNDTSYDVNASLGGQMDKYWDLATNIPTLVKESYRFFGQQSVNEAFSTLVHERQASSVSYVKYDIEFTHDNGILCRCPAFTSESIELISAYEMIEGMKKSNDMSYIQSFISVCIWNGIEEDVIRQFLDYMILTDFAITNTDEHLRNFGVLRNPDTLEILGPAPIYDSGNSMFYKDHGGVPLSRVEILQTEIQSFYDTEEKMLKQVKNPSILDIEKLPTVDEVNEFYTSHHIPEEKADYISKNYGTKCDMLKELQKGEKMSVYFEKRKSRGNENNPEVKSDEEKIPVRRKRK